MTAILIRKVTPGRTPRGPDEEPHYTIDELTDQQRSYLSSWESGT